MTKEQAIVYLRFSGFSDEQIKAIEGAFSGWGKVCPSAGIDCEDCPAYEDTISRKAVLDVTWEEPSYTDALNVLTEVRDKVKALPPVSPQKPKSECEHDHEILKAYSDGASEVLDKVRLDIAQEIITKDSDEYDYEAKWQNMGLRIALKVIDKYKAEGSDKE